MDGLGREDRALGVCSDDEQVRPALLQIATRARYRAAGADRDDDRVELATRLLPDLGARRLVVGLRVPRVRVLVGLEAGGDLLGEPVRDHVVALGGVRLDRGRADHDLCAEGAQEGDLLGRNLVGDDEDHRVALDRGGESEADAGIARGRLDDRPSTAELAVALRVLDHLQADPVLVRAARVQVLELDEQGRAELAADLLEPDDRRPADQIEEGWVFARHQVRRKRIPWEGALSAQIRHPLARRTSLRSTAGGGTTTPYGRELVTVTRARETVRGACVWMYVSRMSSRGHICT